MKFILKNIIALLLILISCFSEFTVELFANFPHSMIDGYKYTYGEFIYYFIIQLAWLIAVIHIYKITKNRESKILFLGLSIWHTMELIQEFNSLFKLNIEFLNKSDSTASDVMQIIFITLVTLVIYLAHTKCTLLFRLLAHSLLLYLQGLQRIKVKLKKKLN